MDTSSLVINGTLKIPVGATDGYVLTSDTNGNASWAAAAGALTAGTTTITGGTAGSVLFVGSASVVQQDNANFFWDDTNNRLGLATSSPGTTLDVRGTTQIIRTDTTTSLIVQNTATSASTHIAEFRNSSGIRLLSIQKAGTNGGWIDFNPSAGACGLGHGGAGANPWIAYSANTGQWVTDSVAGDICYRNTTGRFMFGFALAPSTVQIASAGMTIRPSAVGQKALTVNALSGQTANVMEVQTNGTLVSYFGPQGWLKLGGNSWAPQAALDVEGGISFRRRVVSSTPTTIDRTDYMIAVAGPASARVVNLPAANAVGTGQLFVVSDESGTAATNNITINRAGSDTIEGATSKVINQNYGAVRLYSDGSSQWFTTIDPSGVGTQGYQGATGTGTQGNQGNQGNQGIAGSGTAAGSTTQVQYNNAGAFAGSANLTWDNTNSRLGIGVSPGLSTLDVQGGVRFKRTVVSTTPYTVLATDNIIGVTGPASARALNLPAASTIPAGQMYVISDESGTAATNTITINRNGTDTIQGATTKVINQNYGAVRLYSNGSNGWFTTVDIGNQGNQGNQGTAGVGTQGNQGYQGFQGLTGSGSQGNQGNQGFTGPQGGSGALSIGATTIGGGTTGSMLFVGSSTFLQQDNANIFFDDTNNRLGIGTATPGATLDIQGGVRYKRRVVSTTPTAVTNADYAIAVTGPASARAVNLPAANTFGAGQVLVIVDESGTAATNNITINRAGSDTIDAGTSLVINTNYGGCRLYSDGSTKWFTSAGDIKIGSNLGGTTAGSVLFGGTGGVLQQDNANLFWDDTNNRLGIGTATPQVTLDVNGGVKFKRTAVSTTPYTILITDNIIGVTGPASARSLTLPTAASTTVGQMFVISDESGTAATNNITINRAGSDTIEGQTSYVISQDYGAVRLYSNGSNQWFTTSQGRAIIQNPSSDVRNQIIPDGNFKPLTLKGSASQTKNMLEILNNSNTVMDVFGPQGYFGVGTGANAPIAPVDIRGTVTTDVTAVFRPVASQTADVLQVLDSAGTTKWDKIGSDGRLYIRTPNSAPTDSNIDPSQVTFYLDEGTNNLRVRVKYSNSTVRTGTIALV